MLLTWLPTDYTPRLVEASFTRYSYGDIIGVGVGGQ